jgi:hypothetical protein
VLTLIDREHLFASVFLWAAGAAFLLFFALPLLVTPLHWAKRLGWTLPDDVRLTRYFGRCLGAVAVAIVVMCFRAAPDPEGALYLFELLTIVALLLTAVHVWGAIERAQPASETAEIALYLALTIVAAWLRIDLGA